MVLPVLVALAAEAAGAVLLLPLLAVLPEPWSALAASPADSEAPLC